MKSNFARVTVCAAFLALTGSAFGQTTFSWNIVGYANIVLQPGANLIADQFLSTPDNSLDSILNIGSSYGGLVDGTGFTLWNNGAFLPTSYYDSSSDSWSINYQLNLGQGGYLISSTRVTNTFFGTVGPYFDGTSSNNVGWNPNYPNGLQLVSNPTPISGDLNFEFPNIIGRAPVAGEGVAVLDPVTQTYTESFFDGTQWLDATLSHPSTVTIQVGQAAWFDLGGNYSMSLPSPVPEPGTLALVGLGAGLLFRHRRQPRSS